jgi:hypothetical protein
MNFYENFAFLAKTRAFVPAVERNKAQTRRKGWRENMSDLLRSAKNRQKQNLINSADNDFDKRSYDRSKAARRKKHKTQISSST